MNDAEGVAVGQAQHHIPVPRVPDLVFGLWALGLGIGASGCIRSFLPGSRLRVCGSRRPSACTNRLTK